MTLLAVNGLHKSFGGVVAARRAQGRVVTVAVDAMTFHQPIKVGDIVSIYGSVIRVGRTSMAVKLETIVARRLDPTEIKVTEGVYTYVAIDEHGRPRPVPNEGPVPKETVVTEAE